MDDFDKEFMSAGYHAGYEKGYAHGFWSAAVCLIIAGLAIWLFN